jgi:surfactin synthase thioesterase subunit
VAVPRDEEVAVTEHGGLATGWLRWPVRRPEAALRLVCFPHAGGGASAYWRWPQLLPAQLEVLAVQYPGRQDRFAEPHAESLAELADHSAAELGELIVRQPGPVALFGHSMGALVAFEVARRLRAAGHPSPRRLIVSAHQAPTRPRPKGPAADTDEAVLSYLRELGGTGADMLDDPDLRELTMPMVRGDLRLTRNYKYLPEAPLDCPISAIAGAQDRSCPPEHMRDWATHTSAGFDLGVLPGDHFYTETSTGLLATALTDRLTPDGLATR